MEANNPNLAQTNRILRPSSIKLWKDNARTKTGSSSFSIDTAKLWNECPEEIKIKIACSIGIAKKTIKKYCATFEI